MVVNPPSAMHVSYSLFRYEHDKTPAPRAIRALAPGFRPVTVRRTDEHTLEVEPTGGYLAFFLDRLLPQ